MTILSRKFLGLSVSVFCACTSTTTNKKPQLAPELRKTLPVLFLHRKETAKPITAITCVRLSVLFNDGAPPEIIAGCGEKDAAIDRLEMELTGLTHQVGPEARTALRKLDSYDFIVKDAEKELWECSNAAKPITCYGESYKPPDRPIDERRLLIWNKTRERNPHNRFLAPIDKMCDDAVKSELEIAEFNRTHGPRDQKAQVTDIRKELCGGPN